MLIFKNFLRSKSVPFLHYVKKIYLLFLLYYSTNTNVLKFCRNGIYKNIFLLLSQKPLNLAETQAACTFYVSLPVYVKYQRHE